LGQQEKKKKENEVPSNAAHKSVLQSSRLQPDIPKEFAILGAVFF